MTTFLASLNGQFKRRVNFYEEILFIGLGPGQAIDSPQKLTRNEVDDESHGELRQHEERLDEVVLSERSPLAACPLHLGPGELNFKYGRI